MCEFCEDISEWDLIKPYAGDKDLPDYYLVKMDNKYCLYQNSRYADFAEAALDDIKFCPYCGRSLKTEEIKIPPMSNINPPKEEPCHNKDSLISADVISVELDGANNIVFHYRKPITVEDSDTIIMASDIGEKIYNLINKKKNDKHLKGYIFDSLVYRYKLAREKLMMYEVKADPNSRDTLKKECSRDVLRFLQILDEAIEEYD